MLSNETTRPKRKLILSRETVQILDSVTFHQHLDSDQASKNTQSDPRCTSEKRCLVRRL